jgi:hypothetical protein
VLRGAQKQPTPFTTLHAQDICYVCIPVQPNPEPEARVQLRSWGSGTGPVTYHAQADFDTFQALMP